MRDLGTMLWKEVAEFLGNLRFLRVFAIAVLVMGIVPTLQHVQATGFATAAVVMVLHVTYVLFACAIVVAQTAPDLVLHERLGRTLDYLLATRLPDGAIFAGKVLVAAAIGYVAALAAIALQLVMTVVIDGGGWSWLYLGLPEGQVAALALTACLSLYVAVIGTFVALRVGDQRAAYMVTILSLAVLVLPFLLGWLTLQLTTAWLVHAALVFGTVAVLLGIVGLRLFRREMLVLYLQD